MIDEHEALFKNSRGHDYAEKEYYLVEMDKAEDTWKEFGNDIL